MRRYLFGYQIPLEIDKKRTKAEQDGFCISAYRDQDFAKRQSFLENNFSAGWQYNANKVMQEGKGTEQIQLCLQKDGEVVGYCQRGMDGNPSRFGPFGVSNKYRNHSLGSILFCQMLYDMAKRGIYMMYFLSTNEAGARFYQRHGVKIYRTFRHYHKLFGETATRLTGGPENDIH